MYHEEKRSHRIFFKTFPLGIEILKLNTLIKRIIAVHFIIITINWNLRFFKLATYVRTFIRKL